MKERDIRSSPLYREAEALFTSVRQPGTGQITDAAEASASSNGRYAVFAGTIVDIFEGALLTRICRIDLASGDTRVLTFGPNTDRLPKYSPDGRHIAFLSDRERAGDFQLYLLDPVTGGARGMPRVEGWVEYLHWSPDGRRILLGVAGFGADISGGQGAIASERSQENLASWMPSVEMGNEEFRWRRAWVCDLATEHVFQASQASINIWEAVWCGNERLAAVVSPAPGEGLWYSARLHVIDVDTGADHQIYSSEDQLGWPSACGEGRYLAFVEAVCSDRWIVAGDLKLIDMSTGNVRSVQTGGVDVTYTEWRSDRHLLIAGHRGFETVIATYDVQLSLLTEVWRSRDTSTSGRYVSISGFLNDSDCVLIGESFSRAPEIAVVRHGRYEAIKSLNVGYNTAAKAINAAEPVTWNAPDGLEIQGWLLRPDGDGPHPLVLEIHGGPVWHWRPRWLGRAGLHTLMLVARGYAVLLPNPRGSSGRGQDFARKVKGDMNGADTNDYLSGVDHLVTLGIADPHRLGVTGGSYGGNMTTWLISQDLRFAAAVPVAPHTNHVTEFLLSNIPHFVSLFLADEYNNPGGKYFHRSPVMHADKVKTPTLSICGALDRCTPPEEAVQFHNALLNNGTKSMLVIYPEEGHGVRKLPAAIDFTARLVGWFEEHMPAGRAVPNVS